MPAKPITTAAVDGFISSLAAVGIGVYAPGAPSSTKPISSPASPVRLTETQAAAEALGALRHSGVSGATLDGVVVAPSIKAGAPPIPTSAAILAWALQTDSPAARLARKILGSFAVADYKTTILPTAVLTLFVSDVAMHAAGSGAEQPIPPGTPTEAPAKFAAIDSGICTDVINFVDGTIRSVFAALGHIEIDTSGFQSVFGGFVGGILAGLADAGVAILNSAIDAAELVIIKGVETAIGFVLGIIADIASVVSVVTSMLTMVMPWTPELEADPNSNSKGVDTGNNGQVKLTVTSGISSDWPADITDCAQAAGVTLPALRPTDGHIVWNLTDGGPGAPLVVEKIASPSLDKAGTGVLLYTTTTEDAALASSPNVSTGYVGVTARIERTDLKEIKDQLLNWLWTRFTGPLASVLVPVIKQVLQPQIDGLLDPLTHLIDTDEAFVLLPVTYHTPGTSSSPSPSGGQGYRLAVEFPPGASPIPFLDITSCTGLRGPWSGYVLGGPQHPKLPVSFTLDAKYRGQFGASNHEVTNQDGDVIESDNTYHFAVTVNPVASPAMTFSVATNSETNVLHPRNGGAVQHIDEGTATLPTMKVGTPWPLEGATC